MEWLRPKWKGLGSIYFRFASKLATIFYDNVITDSYQMKLIYKERFKKDSTVIAYGSTIIKSLNFEILKNFNLRPNEYYLVVGRLIPDNNSKMIIEGFINSNSKKKLVIVGDVPYNDDYAKKVKAFRSQKVIFTGYVKCQKILSQLYFGSFCYIHGHEFGGTNPTMINALDANCEILALDTLFTREMLRNKQSFFFKKDKNSVSEIINFFEKKSVKKTTYTLPEIYNWEFIAQKYLDLFNKNIN